MLINLIKPCYRVIFLVILIMLSGSSFAELVLVGSLSISDDVRKAVRVAGNYAYIVDGAEGLKIINIENPASPVLVGSLKTGGYAREITVEGDYAYVADAGTSYGGDIGGLKIINIENPAAPVLVGRLDCGRLSCDAMGVTVVGKYAYVTDYDEGLKIINISNPAAPVLVGSLRVVTRGGHAPGVTVAGKYVYIAIHDGGELKIINIENPAAPVLVGSLKVGNNAERVTVRGDYAYVTDWSGGLKIVNISNPASPVLVGSLKLGGCAYEVTVAGDYAYVADYDKGLKVINIANPELPVLAESFNTDDNVNGVAVVKNYVYVTEVRRSYGSGNGGGLKIIQVVMGEELELLQAKRRIEQELKQKQEAIEKIQMEERPLMRDILLKMRVNTSLAISTEITRLSKIPSFAGIDLAASAIDVARLLDARPDFTSLDLTNTNITDNGWQIILGALRKNRVITEIKYNKDTTSSEVQGQIAVLLALNGGERNLALEPLGLKSRTSFSYALGSLADHASTTLNLSSFTLDLDRVQILAEFIKKNPRLKAINLHGVKCIGEEGGILLDAMKQNTPLNIDFAEAELDEDAVFVLCEFVKDKPIARINFTDCKIPPSELNSLQAALKQNSTIRDVVGL